MAAADAGDDRNAAHRDGRSRTCWPRPGCSSCSSSSSSRWSRCSRSRCRRSPIALLPNYDFTWEWGNFGTAFDDFGEQLLRSFAYAGIATVLCILIAYPIAYFIAFKAGSYRNLLLGLVMVPFFTSFLLRTIAWQSLLADNGPVLASIETLQPRRRARAARRSSTTAGS